MGCRWQAAAGDAGRGNLPCGGRTRGRGAVGACPASLAGVTGPCSHRFSLSPLPTVEHCSSLRCDWKRAVNRHGVRNALALSEDTQERRWHVSDVLCVIPKAKTLPRTTGGSPQGLGKASALSAIIQPGDNVCHYLKRHHWQSDVIFTYLPFFENQILFFFICLTTWLPENASGM